MLCLGMTLIIVNNLYAFTLPPARILSLFLCSSIGGWPFSGSGLSHSPWRSQVGAVRDDLTHVVAVLGQKSHGSGRVWCQCCQVVRTLYHF